MQGSGSSRLVTVEIVVHPGKVLDRHVHHGHLKRRLQGANSTERLESRVVVERENAVASAFQPAVVHILRIPGQSRVSWALLSCVSVGA